MILDSRLHGNDSEEKAAVWLPHSKGKSPDNFPIDRLFLDNAPFGRIFLCQVAMI